MTPLKLKRRLPHLQSTFDRTLCVKTGDTLRDIIPSFVASTKEMPPKMMMIKEEPKKHISATNFENTTQLQERVYQLLNEDSEKSEFSNRNGFRNRSYIDYPAKFKIVKGSSWSIPQRVVQHYSTLEEGQNSKPSFFHGCLSKTAIYYFSIENRVLFYDIGRAVRFNLSFQECFLSEFQFQQRVFQLKEVSWSVPIFSQIKNKNILLVSSPWRISFIVLELPETGALKAENYRRWIKITLLNYHFTLISKKADFLTQGDRQLFYLDDQGRMNRLWFERSNFIDKLFNGEKFKWAAHKKDNSLSSNFFYLNRKATFLDKIKHYNKVIVTEVKNLFSKNAERYGLAYDHKRKLLFSLIDTRYRENSSQKSIEYSYSKMISCWKVVKNKLELQCEISELQLLTSPENQQILSHNIGKNNKISKILPVEESFYPDSCLLLVLQNGIRLYLKIKDESFQIVSFQYPPSFEGTNKQRVQTRKCSEYTKPVQLINFDSETSTHLMTVKEDGQNHTFLIWKDHQMKEQETCSYIHWGESIFQGPGGDAPQQNYFFRSTLGFTNSKKTNILKSLANSHEKQYLLNSENIGSMHSLARDLLMDIPLFFHSTQLYLEYFLVTRSVDLMFMAIESQIFQKKLLLNIFPELEHKDLQFLLLQILCDEEGIYIKDLSIMECFSHYVKTCMESGVFKDFQGFRIQFFNSLASENRQKNRHLQMKPQIVEISTLSSQKRLKICDLLLELSSDEKKNSSCELDGQKYCKEINGVAESVLSYLSRLLRFIWTQELYQISPKAVHLVSMLQSILNVIDTIFDSEYLARAQLEIDSKRYTIFDAMKRIQSKTVQDNKQRSINQKSSFMKSKEKIDKLKHLVNKIIQLLLLCSQVSLKVKRKFFSCLGVEPEFLQQYIFNYIIINHSQPFRVLESYRKIFPLYIGKNLEKSLKIYNETKQLNSDNAFKTAKQHSNLPDYLLAYLKSEKGIRSWQLKQIKDNKEEKMKLDFTFGSREAIEELMAKLNQGHLNYRQRNHLINLINNQLQLYLDIKKHFEDNFYRSTKLQVADISKIITFQQILLQQYQTKEEIDDWVLDHLKNSLLKVDGLKQIVEVMNSNSIKIIFRYYFTRDIRQTDGQSLLLLFEKFFLDERQRYLNDEKSQGFNISQLLGSRRIQKSWKHLEQELMFIIGKIRDSLDLNRFVQLIEKSLEKGDLKGKSISSLLEVLSQQNILNKSLKSWTIEHEEPFISLMLVSAGVDCDSLREIYLKQLHYRIYSERNISQTSLPIIFNIWINLFVLLFEYGGKEVNQFAAKTKELIQKIKISSILKLVKEKQVEEMEALIQILNLAQKESREARKR